MNDPLVNAWDSMFGEDETEQGVQVASRIQSAQGALKEETVSEDPLVSAWDSMFSDPEGTTRGSNVEQPQMGVEPDETATPDELGLGRKVFEAGKEIGTAFSKVPKTIVKTLFSPYDPRKGVTQLYGPTGYYMGMNEIGVEMLAGAKSWIAGKLASEAVNIYGQVLKLEGTKGPDGEELTPEMIAKRRVEVDEAIGSAFHKVYGESKTDIGRVGSEALGALFGNFQRPFKAKADWFAEKGYPNVGLTLAFLGELAAFGVIGKMAHTKSAKVKAEAAMKKELERLSKESDILKIAEGLDNLATKVKAEVSGFEGKPDQIRQKMDVLNPERLALLKNQIEVKKAKVFSNSDLSARAKTKELKKLDAEITKLEKQSAKELANVEKQYKEVLKEEVKRREAELTKDVRGRIAKVEKDKKLKPEEKERQLKKLNEELSDLLTGDTKITVEKILREENVESVEALVQRQLERNQQMMRKIDETVELAKEELVAGPKKHPGPSAEAWNSPVRREFGNKGFKHSEMPKEQRGSTEVLLDTPEHKVFLINNKIEIVPKDNVRQVQPGPRGESGGTARFVFPEKKDLTKRTEAPEETKGKSVEFLSEESIPKAEYQITPEGVKRVTDISSKKEFQIKDNKVKLVLEIPSHKSVFRITKDPLEAAKPEAPKVVYDFLSNQRGNFDPKILTDASKALWKIFGNQKGVSVYNKMVKSVSSDDLALTGADKYLKEQVGQKLWTEKDAKVLAEKMRDAAGIEKEVLGNKFKELQQAEIVLRQYAELEAKTRWEKYEAHLKPWEQLNKKYKDFRAEIVAEELIDYHINNTKNILNSEYKKVAEEYLKLQKQSPKYSPEEYDSLTLSKYKPESYEEVLYKIKTDPKYQEPHFDGIEGINFHVRRHERVVEKTKELSLKEKQKLNTKHIDEIQSKLHDIGRQEGYGRLKFTLEKLIDRWVIKDPKGKIVSQHKLKNDALIIQAEFNKQISVPDVPYKKSWYKIAIRDNMREVVESGKDGLSLNTAAVLRKRYPSVKADFEMLYDKQIPKFIEAEYGIKPERVWTETKSGPVEVWFVPATKTIRERYSAKIDQLFDSLLAPLRNQGGFIKLNWRKQKNFEKMFSPTHMEAMKKIEQAAQAANQTTADFLISRGMTAAKAKDMALVYERVKRSDPFNAPPEFVTPEVALPKVFNIFKLPEGEKQVNIKSKENNQKIKIGESLLEILQNLPYRSEALLFKFFTNPTSFFTSYESIKPLYYMSKDVKRAYTNEIRIVSKTVSDLNKQYSKADRQNAGLHAIAASESGRIALERSGQLKDMKPETIKQAEYRAKMQELWESYINRVNEIRVQIGKRPIRVMKDENGNNNYTPLMVGENIFEGLWTTKEGQNRKPNLILDNLDSINHRMNYENQQNVLKNSTIFKFTKRGKWERGVKLETDPLVLYSRYGKNAAKHIHLSPLMAFVKEFATKDLYNAKTDSTFNLSVSNPHMARELVSWMNIQADIPNLHPPRILSKAAMKLNSHLTASTLMFNLRTVLVGTTSVVQSAALFGPTRVAKASFDMTMGKKIQAMEHSTELKNRILDASITRPEKAVVGTRLQKFSTAKDTAGMAGILKVDYYMAELAWRTAYDYYKGKHPEMSDRQIARMADEIVVKTQSSGSPEDLSPIQRNALGKTLTLWQTFTIQNTNFLAREVLGIKNPNVSKNEVVARSVRFALGAALVSHIMEDQLGVHSVFPRPIQALQESLEKGDPIGLALLDSMVEAGTILPLLGGIKLGSTVFGAGVDFGREVSEVIGGSDRMKMDLIQRSLDGDRNAQLVLAKVLGVILKVRGTQQASKYVRGREQGKDHVDSLLGVNEDMIKRDQPGTHGRRKAIKTGSAARRKAVKNRKKL